MALQLTKTDGAGQEWTYHRIGETNINWADRRCHITLLAYRDQAARDAGLLPGGPAFSRTLEGDAFPFSGLDDERAIGERAGAIYTFCKSLPEWEDATDV
jgi:hypothetical protein